MREEKTEIQTVDLNCDLGESYGIYQIGQDEELLRIVTSANIACGFHAGDPAVMRRTVERCLAHGVAIGAHPGLPDREAFGRRAMDITPEEAYEMTIYQIGALHAFVQASGGTLHHVKPHGALYHMASTDYGVADAIARAVANFDRALTIYGLAGSELIRAAEAFGLRTASEVFPDRRYEADGSLTSRRHPDALVDNVEEAAAQAVSFVCEGTVMSRDGSRAAVRAETICIHGDGPHAVPFAAAIREALTAAGVRIQAF